MESKYSVIVDNTVVKVELAGRLDASNSEGLQGELKKLAGTKVAKLVFFVKELEYISSAGLRVIIFAKQKLGMDAEVFMIGAQESVAGVVKMSGLDNFMHLQDSFAG